MTLFHCFMLLRAKCLLQPQFLPNKLLIVTFLSSVADIPDMCSSINETFVDIRSLALNFTTQTVTSAVACRCSITAKEPCETAGVTTSQNHPVVTEECVFNSAVQEKIDVRNNEILGVYGRGLVWRETCQFDYNNCSQCSIASNVTFTEDSLNTTRKLTYFFRQLGGYGPGQYMTGSIVITGTCRSVTFIHMRNHVLFQQCLYLISMLS